MYKALKTFIPTVTNMIRADHTHVLATFHQYEIDTSPGTKRALVNTICAGLEIHAQLEEEIFYPAMRAVAGDAGVVGKSVPEHDEMRRLIARLREMEPEDAGYDATVMELMRDVLHHVADEETILLPDAERVARRSPRGARQRHDQAAPRAGGAAHVSSWPGIRRGRCRRATSSWAPARSRWS